MGIHKEVKKYNEKTAFIRAALKKGKKSKKLELIINANSVDMLILATRLIDELAEKANLHRTTILRAIEMAPRL